MIGEPKGVGGLIRRELFWAALKSMLIMALITTPQLGKVFNEVGFSEGFLYSYGGALLAVAIGCFLFLPIIWVLSILSSPFFICVYKRGLWEMRVLMIVGALSSLVFMSVLSILTSKDLFSLPASGVLFLWIFEGGLTGFFLFKQSLKSPLVKREGV